MLRSLFEKVPTLITKSEISSPKVKFIIRPLSHVKRSYSYADAVLSETSKQSNSLGYLKSDNNSRRKPNKTASNETGDRSKEKKKTSAHRSRRETTCDGDFRCLALVSYELEAARPRSRSEIPLHKHIDLENLNTDQTRSLLHLQPGNLEPVSSRRGRIINACDESYCNDPQLKMSSMNLSAISNSRLNPRPSYSEYIRLKKTSTKLGVPQQTKLLGRNNIELTNFKCNVRNYCNVAEEKVSENCCVSNLEQEQCDQINEEQKKTLDEGEIAAVKLSEMRNSEQNVADKQKLLPRINLPRLNIPDGRSLPCYSDYVKTKAKKKVIVSDEGLEKLNTLAISPNRSHLLQNVAQNSPMQKRDYSSMTKYGKQCKRYYKNLKSNYANCNKILTFPSNLLSKSFDNHFLKQILMSRMSSRTLIVCPAYSDYVKQPKDIEKSSNIVDGYKETKSLLANNPINMEVIQKCLLCTKHNPVKKIPQTANAIASLSDKFQQRNLSTTGNKMGLATLGNHVVKYDTQHPEIILVPTKRHFKQPKKCKPKKDPCAPEKPKKCFLTSKVRLPAVTKCGAKFKPCPIVEKCPPRADDCMCVLPKKLPFIENPACVCIEPYVPDRAPGLKRLKLSAPDPPRICPTPYCPIPRADDNLVEVPKCLPFLKPKPCDCVQPPPQIDVPLVRLKKICEPESKCYPPKPCPPPPPCKRADDDLCTHPKHLPILHAPICPCIEETIKDVPPLKRLYLQAPEPARECPRSCVCHVDCPRADDSLVVKVKPLPPIQAGDCPCVETEMVDVNFKRLACREDPEECFYVDPCEVPQPRADFGCWEYYIPEPKQSCKEQKIESKKKPRKKKKKVCCRPS